MQLATARNARLSQRSRTFDVLVCVLQCESEGGLKIRATGKFELIPLLCFSGDESNREHDIIVNKN